MSFLINSFLLNSNAIVSVENPVAISVPNGTAAGSIGFQATVRSKLSSGFYRNVPVSFDTTPYNSAVNGFYTLTGTLSPGGSLTNPFSFTATIIVWVLPPPYFWKDSIDLGKLTGSIDNITRLISVVTGKVGATNGVSPAGGALLRRPSWNGEGIYYNTQSVLEQSSAKSFFVPFHNGTQFTIYVVWKQLAVTNTYLGPIYDSINGSSANKGISLFVDNRSSVSRTMTLYAIVASGVAAPVNLASSNNAVVVGWNWAKVTYNGTNVVITTNGTQVASAAPGAAFGVGDATNLLHFGNLFTVGTSTGLKGYYKHLYMQNSFMSAPDQTTLDAWAAAMCLENLIVEDANVYLRIGQSNQAGRGLNSGIAGDLTGAVGARIMVVSPTPPTQTNGSGVVGSDSYWEQLELARNQTFESVATVHGMEMRFGKDMWALNESCWIVKMGVGGTPIFSTVTYNDWNVSTAQLYTLYLGLTGTALDELTHVFRKNPVVRGLSIMQGETDAIITGAGAVYHTNWTTFINTFIDALVTLGYTINKLRIFFWQITDVGGAAYDPTEFAAVKAAQVAFPAQYFIDFPSRTANVKGITTRTTDDISLIDTQHYDEDGLDAMGVHEVDYFKIWTTE